MFFQQEVLTRRKGLGIVWLAATLGHRSTSLRKITRKELDNVNISKTCKTVATPPEPLALRLSSQLMFGVVRIYSSKSEQFVADVIQAHANMRKTIAGLIAADGIIPMGHNIDLPNSKVPNEVDQTQVPASRNFFDGDFDCSVDWAWQAFLDGHHDSTQSSAGIASAQLEPQQNVGSSSGADGPECEPQARYVAPLNKITLSKRSGELDSAFEEPEADLQMRGFSASASDRFALDDLCIPDALNLDLGLDIGLEPFVVDGFAAQSRQELYAADLTLLQQSPIFADLDAIDPSVDLHDTAKWATHSSSFLLDCSADHLFWRSSANT